MVSIMNSSKLTLKKVTYFFLVLTFVIVSVSITATTRNKKIQSKIESGVYIPQDLMSKRRMMKLPIPKSNENYAFIQSFMKITNVIIGEFAEGEQKITWVHDENGDGKVETVIYFYPELQKFKEDPNPHETVTQEDFKSLKEDILNGKQGNIFPNKEGIPPLKKLIEKNSDKIEVVKNKNGYSIRIPDVDDTTRTRISFMFSNNRIKGYDLVFEVNYHNLRETLVAPVIKNSVYCKNSFDPVVVEYTQDLLEHTARYYPYK